MCLAHYLFAFWHKGFRPAVQVNNHCSAFVSYNRTAYDFALSLNELGIDTVSLVSTYLLYHHLFGGLGGDSAETFYIDFLVVFKGRDLTGIAVDAYYYIAFRLTKVLPRCRDHSFFQVHKYRFLLDVFIAGNVFHDS